MPKIAEGRDIKNSHAFQRGALVNRRPFNLIWLQKKCEGYTKNRNNLTIAFICNVCYAPRFEQYLSDNLSSCTLTEV